MKSETASINTRHDVVAFVVALSMVMLGVLYWSTSYAYEGFTSPNNFVTIQDSTNLMWTSTTSSDLLNFAQAEAYCEDASIGGYTDWRIPSALEFRGLTDLTINPTLPPALSYDYRGFWALYGKIVQFNSTNVTVQQTPNQLATRYVHCVRDNVEAMPVYLTVPVGGNEWKVSADSTLTTQVFVNDTLAAAFQVGTVNLGVLEAGDTIHVLVDGLETEEAIPTEYNGLPAWELWFLNGTIVVDVFDPVVEPTVCPFDEFDIEDAYQAGAASVEPVVEYVEIPVEKIVYVEVPVEVEKIVYVTIPAEEEDDHHDNGHHYGNDKEDNHVDEKDQDNKDHK